MLWAWLPRKSGGAIQGRIQDFPNWGLKPTIRKAGGGVGGGGGVLYASGPIRNGGGGVLYTTECGGRLLSEDA